MGSGTTFYVFVQQFFANEKQRQTERLRQRAFLSVLITYYIIIFAKLVEVGYCTFQCVSGCPANSTRKL